MSYERAEITCQWSAHVRFDNLSDANDNFSSFVHIIPEFSCRNLWFLSLPPFNLVFSIQSTHQLKINKKKVNCVLRAILFHSIAPARSTHSKYVFKFLSTSNEKYSEIVLFSYFLNFFFNCMKRLGVAQHLDRRPSLHIAIELTQCIRHAVYFPQTFSFQFSLLKLNSLS